MGEVGNAAPASLMMTKRQEITGQAKGCRATSSASHALALHSQKYIYIYVSNQLYNVMLNNYLFKVDQIIQ